MATITPPYADPGRAAFQELDTYLSTSLLAGPHPKLKPAYPFPAAAGTVLAQFAVVGLDGSGNVVAATTAVKPIGVLAHAKLNGDVFAEVWYSGNFNQDFLTWDASLNTDTLKQAAFRGSPTPTNIIISKR